MLMNPELKTFLKILVNFGEFHHCKNKKFENFDESQLKMVSPGPGATKLENLLKSKNILK